MPISRIAGRRRWWLLLGIAALVLPLLSLGLGAAALDPATVIRTLASHLPGVHLEVDRIDDAILWQNRTPRVIVAVAVGAILAVCGVAMQAVVRNPLAEPYVLGVSSGASVGAAVALVGIGAASAPAIGALSFVGAFVAIVLVIGFAGLGRGTMLGLVLAGLAVGFLGQAITNLIIFSADSPETSRSVVFWMLGSLSRAHWGSVPLIVVVAALTVLGAAVVGPVLDALATGDQMALGIGIDPARARLLVLIPISAAVAAAVAVAGGIGFVGLVIPHLMRPLFGAAHRSLVVAAALGGAIFLALADATARTVFAPAELPLGVVTGLVGAPFLLLLVVRAQWSTR